MDSLSDKIEFKYSKLQSDVDDPTEDWQLLLRVTARFSIWIRGKIFFDEPDFPVVEFAEQAKQWALNGGNFSYVSDITESGKETNNEINIYHFSTVVLKENFYSF